MICVPIIGPDMKQALEDISFVNGEADLLELRLDLIKNFDLKQLVESTGKDVIVTVRSNREGGQWDGDVASAIKELRSALNLGVRFIDVEWHLASELTKEELGQAIISRHFFDEFPSNLKSILDELNEIPGAVTKIAMKIDQLEQNAEIFQLLRDRRKDTILIGMGELGRISRIAARAMGGFLTFAALSSGKESAPGQVTLAELKNKYYTKNNNQETKLYGVIGNPIGHSMSPDIHNAGFNSIGFNALYLPLKVERVESFMSELAPYFDGFSVTIPHKEIFFTIADKVEEVVNKIGALNTLTKLSDGRWEGKNTDISAAIDSVIEKLDDKSLKDKRVLVIGAGGAARAIVIGAKYKGANVTIANRTVSKGQKIANELEVNFISLEKIQALASLDYNVIMNTTSVGMSPEVDVSPLPKTTFKEEQVVFDAIYNPDKTKLILKAEEDGAKIITGREMFVKQGALQFEHWTKKTCPLTLFREILNKKLG
ncbi:MAG: shikimate dehydrogenase [Planctomycetota bacterium]|nr:MAG: shikimate dehydrogenase [Planctomycetota bacterium]